MAAGRRSSPPSSLCPPGTRSSGTHLRRRHPGPPRPQRSSDRTHRRKPAPARGKQSKRLDLDPRKEKKFLKPTGQGAPGRIISLQGGDIIQESLGAIIPL